MQRTPETELWASLGRGRATHDLKQQKRKLELQQRLTMADREDGGQSRETVNQTRKRVNKG
jgi:hypothetical protein